MTPAGSTFPVNLSCLAVFVSPHGFGHAARASAVMDALHRRWGARFRVYTTVPRWFFDETVAGTYAYVEVETDVGFRQRTALAHDLDATVEALRRMIPFDAGWVTRLAEDVVSAGCSAVLCDIAPLGIAVAERAGLPSMLVENFTWDALYRPFTGQAPSLGPLADALESWFVRATMHVQTEPLCRADAEADLVVAPISRPPRADRQALRRALGLDAVAPVVVLTMGGVPHEIPFLERLRRMRDVTFLVTGLSETRVEGNLRLFDHRTHIYMPHFIRAADAVVAKLGYSTVAEAWREGRPLAFVTREGFPETAPVRAWVLREMSAFEIPGEGFDEAEWVARIPELLAMPQRPFRSDGGAEQVAEYLGRQLVENRSR